MFVDREQHRDFVIVRHANGRLLHDDLEKVITLQIGIRNVEQRNVLFYVADHFFQKRGFAGSDLTTDHDKSFRAPYGRVHEYKRTRVLTRHVEEIFLRRHAERMSVETKMI